MNPLTMLFGLWLSLLPLTAQDTQDEMVMRVYPVAALLHQQVPAQNWPTRLVLPPCLDQGMSKERPEASAGLYSDQLIEMLRHGELEGADLYMSVEGGNLRVGGPASAVKEVEARLMQIAALASQQWRVELWQIGANQGGTLLAATTASGGVRTTMSAQDRVPMLVDYDVEVAQKARIADPIVTVVPVGINLTFELLPAAAGKLMVRAALRGTELVSVDRVGTQTPHVGAIQRPTLHTLIGTASGLVGDGGSIDLALGGERHARRYRLKIIGKVLDGVRVGDAEAIAGGAVQRPSWGQTLEPLPLPTRSGGNREWEGDEEKSIAVSYDELVDLAQSTGEDDVQIAEMGLYHLVKPASSAGMVRGLVAAMAGPRTSARKLELRVTSTGGEEEEVLAAFSTRTLVGDDQILVAGRESTYLSDQDVEIAQESVIADPVTRPLFDGCAFEVRIEPAPAGFWLRGSWQVVLRETAPQEASVHTGTENVGVVEVPRLSLLAGPLSMAMPQGDTMVEVASIQRPGGRTLRLWARILD